MDSRERAAEVLNKIIEICGESAVHVTDQQKRDAAQYIYGLMLEARGRGIRAGVLKRARKRDAIG